ncbi:hypothetical protein GCM10027020_35580 [Nocardioides salsibiostraticola]
MTLSSAFKFLTPLTMASVLVLGGCTGDDDGPTPSGETVEAEADPDGRIVESGFAQDGEFIQSVTLVENTSAVAGQNVTLISDFLDADGKAVGSETLVTAFNFPGQTIAMVGGSAVKGKAQVASIESELIIEPADNSVSKLDFGSVEGTNLTEKNGEWSADFTVANPSNKDLRSPDVAVVCRDASGAINGGGVDFPDLVPAKGETVVSPFLLVEGDPAECTAYISDPL